MEHNEFYASAEEYLVAKATKNKIPLYGIFELTPLCNLNCDMCYVRLSHDELIKKGNIHSLNEWLDIAKELVNAGTLFILLTGGEPLLYPDFKELYLALQKMGMIITLNTNGTMINEEWAQFFAKNRPRRINITMYGSGEATYESLCHNKSGYNSMLNGIKLLKEASIDLKINGSIIGANKNDASDILRYAKANDIFAKLDCYMFPSAKKNCLDEVRLDAKEAARLRVKVLKESLSGDEAFINEINDAYAKCTTNIPKTDDDCHIKCRAGKSSFVIHWDGTMTPCTLLTTPAVNVFETGFNNAWNIIMEKTASITTNSTCNSCKLKALCQTCAACAYAETGAFDGLPKYMCEYAEETFRIVEQYHKEFNEDV